jgi:hypothetical protein
MSAFIRCVQAVFNAMSNCVRIRSVNYSSVQKFCRNQKISTPAYSNAHRAHLRTSHWGQCTANDPGTIECLERKNASLADSLATLESAGTALRALPGDIGSKVKVKFDDVMRRNPGISKLKEINAVLSGEGGSLEEMPMDIAIKYKFAPVTSVDVERYVHFPFTSRSYVTTVVVSRLRMLPKFWLQTAFTRMVIKERKFRR